jgi:hypothetical protein
MTMRLVPPSARNNGRAQQDRPYVLGPSLYGKPEPNRKLTAEAFDALLNGASYWVRVEEPFLRGTLTALDVEDITRRGRVRTNGNDEKLFTLFNLRPDEHARFVAFQHKHTSYRFAVQLE